MYVVQMRDTVLIPSDSSCQVHVIDRWGRLIRSFSFNVGYSVRPEAVTFDESRYGFPCLTVETRVKWLIKTRLFYRVTDNHVELLRRERLDGTMDMGNGNAFEIAEKPEDWSDWRRLVASDDTLDQLRGLAAFWSYDNQENMGTIDETTQRRLEQLSKSDNSWIREESAAAIRLFADGRP